MVVFKTLTEIISRQKNSESRHLEGQKALDEEHFWPVPYSKIMSPNTSFSTPLTQVDKALRPVLMWVDRNIEVVDQVNGYSIPKTSTENVIAFF